MTPHHSNKLHQMHLLLNAPSSLLVSGPFGLIRPPSLLSANLPMVVHYLKTVYDCTTPALGLKYKPVARKVWPVATTLPEQARPKQQFLEDPLLLSSWDPCPIAKIPFDPRSIPYRSSDSVPTILRYSDTTLTKTPNSEYPWTLRHIFYCSPNSEWPRKTLITFLSSFVFIIPF